VAWTAERLDADDFLARADAAMYESKRTHRTGVTLFAAAGGGTSVGGEAAPERSENAD